MDTSTSPVEAVMELELHKCLLCRSTFAPEPGPQLCGRCLAHGIRPGTVGAALTAADRSDLRYLYLARARNYRLRRDALEELGFPAGATGADQLADQYRRAARILR